MEKVGNFQATIIFSILYFLLVLPFGYISKLFKDFFKMNQFPKWEKNISNLKTIEEMKSQ